MTPHEYTIQPGQRLTETRTLTGAEALAARGALHTVQFGCAQCGRQYFAQITLQGAKVDTACECGSPIRLAFTIELTKNKPADQRPTGKPKRRRQT